VSDLQQEDLVVAEKQVPDRAYGKALVRQASRKESDGIGRVCCRVKEAVRKLLKRPNISRYAAHPKRANPGISLSPQVPEREGVR